MFVYVAEQRIWTMRDFHSSLESGVNIKTQRRLLLSQYHPLVLLRSAVIQQYIALAQLQIHQYEADHVVSVACCSQLTNKAGMNYRIFSYD